MAKFAAVTLRSSARRALACVLLCAGFGVLGMPGATAQTRDAGAKKLDSIRQLMEQGQALYLSGNPGGAAEVFENGYKQYPYPAFLFNAGVSYQKLNAPDKAIDKFRAYLVADPTAPDADKVRARIAALEKQLTPPAPTEIDAGVGGAADAAVPSASASAAPPPGPPVPTEDDQVAMRSLVVIETEPPGAPLRLFARVDDAAPPFELGGANKGWREITTSRSPTNLTLAVGKYHVVVDKFRDFNESQADIDVSPGHVYQFKANLSQGEFMAFLRVTSNVKGAYIWLDDPKKAKAFWATTPHGELVSGGEHSVLVEAPGFEPLVRTVNVSHGEQQELEVELVRVGYGFLRIDSNAPEVSVTLDEQAKGTWKVGTQPLEIRASSGHHKLVVTADGRKTFEGAVEVPRGQVLPVHVKMIPKYPRGAAWTQAIIGAAFIGAATYFGLESNRIYDDLERDRRDGRLEETDSRVTKGRWYSVGADAGFAVGGVLAALATYNFIKDPLPPSSVKTDKPVEFDDPLKERPVARRASELPQRLVRREPEPAPPPRRPNVGLGAVSPDAAGLFVGGTF